MKSFSSTIIRFEIFLCLVIATPSCHRKADTGQKSSRTVIDMAGRKVTLPDSIHSAFIDRMSVQLVYAFDTVMPVNKVFNYNDSEKKYLAKSFYEGKPYCIDDNAEQIIRMKPQVMLFCRPLTKMNIAELEKLQRETNIPIVLFDQDFLKTKEALALMGKVLHKEQKADELTLFVQKYADPIIQAGSTRAESAKKKIYYAEGMKGFNTDPKGSIHSLLFDLVGAKNVAQTDILEGKGLTNVSPEQVYLWNPDAVVVWSGNFDSLDSYRYIKTSPQWASLAAVRCEKVYQVPWRPFGWIDRPPGINRLIGLVWLEHLLYPQEQHYDVNRVIKEYFQKFYHYTMTDTEVNDITNPMPKI